MIFLTALPDIFNIIQTLIFWNGQLIQQSVIKKYRSGFVDVGSASTCIKAAKFKRTYLVIDIYFHIAKKSAKIGKFGKNWLDLWNENAKFRFPTKNWSLIMWFFMKLAPENSPTSTLLQIFKIAILSRWFHNF